MYLIQGPPGTGKTSTLAKIAAELVRDPSVKILITSGSNVGIDNLIVQIANLLGESKGIIRFGNPSRASTEVQKYLCDEIVLSRLNSNIEYQNFYQIIEDIREEINILETQSKYPDPKIIKSLENEIQENMKELMKIENEVVHNLSDSFQIFAATLCSIYDPRLQQIQKEKGNGKSVFKYVLVDEAGQALNYLLYIGLLQANKIIFAGDHKQLPPIVKAKENAGKHFSLFEELIERTKKLPNANDYSIMLRRQYRMNSKIMNISSSYIYENLLIADKSAANRNLQLKPSGLGSNVPQGLRDLFGENCVLLFINTDGSFYGEREIVENIYTPKDKSKRNEGEAELVVFTILMLKRLYQVSEKEIGVITPYRAQSDFIGRRIDTLVRQGILKGDSSVSTVDAFQGQEREVIIISTVRANRNGEIGFLSDLRRMNVAITRPKRMLIFVGDENTIKKNEFIQFIINSIKEHGKVIKPEEIDGLEVSGQVFRRDKHFRSGVLATEEVANSQKEPKEKKFRNAEIRADNAENIVSVIHGPGIGQFEVKFTKNIPKESSSENQNGAQGVKLAGMELFLTATCDEVSLSNEESRTISEKLTEQQMSFLLQLCQTRNLRVENNENKNLIIRKIQSSSLCPKVVPKPRKPDAQPLSQNEQNQSLKKGQKLKNNEVWVLKEDSRAVSNNLVSQKEHNQKQPKQPPKQTLKQEAPPPKQNPQKEKPSAPKTSNQQQNGQNTEKKNQKQSKRKNKKNSHQKSSVKEVFNGPTQKLPQKLVCQFYKRDSNKFCNKRDIDEFDCFVCHRSYCVWHILPQKHGCEYEAKLKNEWQYEDRFDLEFEDWKQSEDNQQNGMFRDKTAR